MPYRLYLPQIEKAAPPPDKALEIFRLVRDHPGQQRDRCVWHPVLAKVAKAKASDFATRNYYGHVSPDGYGANFLVRQAGYTLPAYYHSARDGNNIESINAGSDEVSKIWQSWLNSPGHRPHILGEGFYRDQTNIGVGFYRLEGSKYGAYWVFISAPPE